MAEVREDNIREFTRSDLHSFVQIVGTTKEGQAIDAPGFIYKVDRYGEVNITIPSIKTNIRVNGDPITLSDDGCKFYYL